MIEINRREFLKLSGMVALGGALSELVPTDEKNQENLVSEMPNTQEERVRASENFDSSYALWKEACYRTLPDGRGIIVNNEPDPANTESEKNFVVSEGLGYGLMISAIADDQETFNTLFITVNSLKNSDGLIPWKRTQSLEPPKNDAGELDKGTNGPATDAEFDIAFGEYLGYLRWRKEEYRKSAKEKIDAIMKGLIESDTYIIKPGEWGGSENGNNIINPSYSRLFYYPIFEELSGDTRWQKVFEKNVSILTVIADRQTDLVSDWSTTTGGEAVSDNTHFSHVFGYDAIRVPLFTSLLLLDNPDNLPEAYKPGAQVLIGMLQKMLHEAFEKYGAQQPGALNLDGTRVQTWTDPSPVFSAPVAAVALTGKSEADALFRKKMLIHLTQQSGHYYGEALKSISLGFISGKLLRLLKIPRY